MYDEDAESIGMCFLQKVANLSINEQAIPIILVLNHLNNLITLGLGDLILPSRLFIQRQIVTKGHNRWFAYHYEIG